MQIPGGWLLDKFGSKKVYSYSLFFWSLFTFLQGFIDVFPLAWAGVSMFFMRFMLGFSEAPSFPANARIVAAWFPAKERGTASAIFNAAQYFSLALFSPLLGWLTFALGWEHVFTVMGIIGFVLTIIWVKFVHNPTDHPRMSAAELKYISEGGAVVDMDHKKEATPAAGPKMDYIRQLLTNRMMLGVFFGQYFLNTITWFFLTWFPIYLVQDKGMSILKVGFVASIPALFGFAGGVLGGLFSDYLIGRGCTLTLRVSCPLCWECCWRRPSSCVTTRPARRWSLRLWRWRSLAKALARWAGRLSRMSRRRRLLACAAGYSTSLAMWPRSPRRWLLAIS